MLRAHLPRFKHCYDRELNANPNLAGKVSVYFTIAPTGAVGDATIRETTMHDKNVEQCLTRVMRSLTFPKPAGGGVVYVTYPFIFTST